MKSFSLIIPIYNEEGILQNQIDKLTKEIEAVLPHAEYEIVLVENGSTDKTYNIAKKLTRRNGHIRVFHLEYPSYGQAFKEGVKQAKFEVVVQFDIDFWDIDFLELSLLLLDRYDIVIGSKNLGTSKDERPLSRKIISKSIELFLKLYYGLPYSDTHGMKAMRRNRVVALLDEVRCQNHFFDSELLIICYYSGYSFKELPVTLREIRSTRFSFLIRALEALQEFRQLILIKQSILNSLSLKPRLAGEEAT